MAGTSSHWEVAVMRPGGDPLTNLASALIEADLYDADEEGIVDQVRTTLNRSALGLSEAVRQSDAGDASHVLIVIDQFEEIFRFQEQGGRSRDEAAAFVKLLLEAAAADDPSVYVVLTMRSDYLGDCARFRGLAQAVNEGEYLIPRLTRNQRRSAISGPIRVGGAEVSKRLLQKLLNDVGDDPDQLPVLQHALMRTWEAWAADHQSAEEIDLRHYEATGGMGEALSRHADELYENLPDDNARVICERLFKGLTERVSEGRSIRRPLRFQRLVELSRGDRGAVEGLVETFRAAGCTFLMPPADKPIEDETIVDLSHESLMRVWTRLRTWVDAEAQSAGIYRRLSDTARLYTEGKAGLYHDPDLRIATSWWDQENPSVVWAKLYGDGFSDASDFLKQSQDEALVVERAREEARQRELKQSKALAASRARSARQLKVFGISVSALALVACLLALWAFQLKETADANADSALEAREKAERLEKQARSDQGELITERALRLAGDNFWFDARFLMAKVLGFEGHGRSNASPAFQERHPHLFDPGSPEWISAEEFLDYTRDFDTYPLWSSERHLLVEARDIALSMDGSRLITGSAAGAQCWNLESGALLGAYSTNNVSALCLSSDRSKVFVSEAQSAETEVGSLRVDCYAIDDFSKPLYSIHESGVSSDADHKIRGLAVDRTGRLLAAAHVLGVIVWDLSGEPRVLYRSKPNQVPDLSGTGLILLSDDGRYLARILLANEKVELIDIGTGETVWTKGTRLRDVRDAAFAPDSQSLVVGGMSVDGNQGFAVIDLETGEETAPFQRTDGPIHKMLFDPANPRRLLCLEGLVASIWDLNTGARVVALDGMLELHGLKSPRKLDISGDGHWLVASDNFGKLSSWDLSTLKPDRLSAGAQTRIQTFTISPDGSLLAGGVEAGLIQLRDAASGRTVRVLKPSGTIQGKRPRRIAFRPDGTEVAAIYSDLSVEIFDVNTGERVHFLEGAAEQRIGARGSVLGYSPDGRYLVRAFNSALQIRDTETMELVGSTGKVEISRRFDFHPSGQWLALSMATETRIFRLPDGKFVASYSDSKGDWSGALAFSPDGASLAVARDADDVVDILAWDDRELRFVRSLERSKSGRVNRIAFSPDGRLLAGLNYREMTLWNVHSGIQLCRLHDDPQDDFKQLKFSPSGDVLTTLMSDGALVYWNVPGTAQGASASYEKSWGCTFFDHGTKLVTTGEGGLHIMNALTFERLETVSPYPYARKPLVTADGSALVIDGRGRYLYDLGYNRRFALPHSDSDDNPRASLSRDAELLAIPTDQGVALWTIAERQEFAQLDIHVSEQERHVSRIALSPDKQDVALAFDDGAVSVWRIEERTQRLKLPSPFQETPVEVRSLVWSLDGQFLAAGYNNGSAVLWNLFDEIEVNLLGTIGTMRVDVAFDPESRLVAGVSANQPWAWVWDVNSKELVAKPFFRDRGSIVDFGPDGRLVIETIKGNVHLRRVTESAPVSYETYLSHGSTGITGTGYRRWPSENLYPVPGLPMQAAPGRSELAIRQDNDDPVEQRIRLMNRFLSAGNLNAAVLVFRSLPRSAQSQVDASVKAHVLTAAETHLVQKRLAMAEFDLSRAEDLFGRSVETVTLRTRLKREQNEIGPFEELDAWIRELSDETANQSELLGELLTARTRILLEAGDWSGAQDSMENLSKQDPAVIEEALALALNWLNPDVLQEREGDAALSLDDALALAVCRFFHSALYDTSPTWWPDVRYRHIKNETEWAYYDFENESAGSSLAGFTQPEYDDRHWKRDRGPFGYLREMGRKWNVELRAGVRYYPFRVAFQIDDYSLLKDLPLRVTGARDEGLVLYLNGDEMWRDNMPEGDWTSDDLDTLWAEDSRHTVFERTLPPSPALRKGKNVLAVALFQSQNVDLDLFLDMELSSLIPPQTLLSIPETRLSKIIAGVDHLLPEFLRKRARLAIQLGRLTAEEAAASQETDPAAWRFRALLLESVEPEQASEAELRAQVLEEREAGRLVLQE